MAVISTLATRGAWRNIHANPSSRVADVSAPTITMPNADFTTAMEFDVRDGESVHCSSCERCEVSGDHATLPHGIFDMDVEYYLDWWWRVSSAYPTSTNAWQIATQIHLDTTSVLGAATQPVLVLALVNRSIIYRTSYGPASSNYDRVVGTFAVDTWYRSTWRFNLSRTPANGVFQAWLNGTEVIAEEHPRLLPANENDGHQPYLKQGMYRGPTVNGNCKVFIFGTRVHDSAPSSTGGGGTPPPGPTITAPPDAKRFGKITGTAWTGMGADAKRGSVYSLTEDADATHLACWMDGNGSAASGSQVVRADIYDADDALVAESAQVTITKGQAAGWVTFALPSTVRLKAGDYRLALHSGGTGQIGRYAHGTTAGALSYGADAYADGAATGWGVSGVDAKDMAIYVAYAAATTGGGGEPTTPGGMRVTVGSRVCVGSRPVTA